MSYAYNETFNYCKRLLDEGTFPTAALVRHRFGLRGDSLSGDRAAARRECLLTNGYEKDPRSGRFVRKATSPPHYTVSTPGARYAAPAVGAARLDPLASDRQKKLMEVISGCFENYKRRGQTYFGLEGMSTSHIVLKACANLKSIRIFWPTDLVRTGYAAVNGDVQYVLTEDCFERVQDAVRDCLKQLAARGYLERLGNEHERRWRPSRAFAATGLSQPGTRL